MDNFLHNTQQQSRYQLQQNYIGDAGGGGGFRSTHQNQVLKHFGSYSNGAATVGIKKNLLTVDEVAGAAASVLGFSSTMNTPADGGASTSATDLYKFTCDICPRRFTRSDLLLAHQHTHTKERRFKCPHCDKSFIANHHLKNHVQGIHSSVKLFNCPTCLQNFSQRSSLVRHTKKVHGGLGLDKPTQFSTISHTIQNNTQSESVNEAAVANNMPVFPSSQAHSLMTGYSGRSDGSSGKDFRCEICGRFLSNADSLRRHSRTHDWESRFKCDLCDKSYTSTYSLHIHTKCFHQNIRDYHCDQCDKTFYNATHLNNHKLTVHSEVKNFTCHFCQKQFKLKKILRQHEKAQHTVIMHSCFLCSRTYKDKSSLVHHVFTDHSVSIPGTDSAQPTYRPAACNNLVFSNKKPRVCKLCGMNFTRQDSLRRHCKNMHPSSVIDTIDDVDLIAD